MTSEDIFSSTHSLSIQLGLIFIHHRLIFIQYHPSSINLNFASTHIINIYFKDIGLL